MKGGCLSSSDRLECTEGRLCEPIEVPQAKPESEVDPMVFKHFLFELDEMGCRELKIEFKFPAWTCHRYPSGKIIGSFANDVLVAGQYLPRGGGAYSDSADPRRTMFSKSKVLARGRKYHLITAPARECLQDVILLPGVADNYFHFVFDVLGTYLMIDPEIRAKRQVVFGGVVGDLKPFQRELLKMVGINSFYFFNSSQGEIQFENSIWCQNSSYMNIAHPLAVQRLTERLLPVSVSARKREKTSGRRVFFFRKGQRRLPPKNLQQIRRMSRDHALEFIDPSTLTVREQIDLMSETELLVAEGGAALVNALFMPESSVVIMLTSRFHQRDSFVPIMAARGLRFISIFSEPTDFFPDLLHIWTESVASVNHAHFLAALQKAEEFLSENPNQYRARVSELAVNARRDSIT